MWRSVELRIIDGDRRFSQILNGVSFLKFQNRSPVSCKTCKPSSQNCLQARSCSTLSLSVQDLGTISFEHPVSKPMSKPLNKYETTFFFFFSFFFFSFF